jgi:hypothetical protein
MQRGQNFVIPEDQRVFRQLQARQEQLRDQLEQVTDAREDLARDVQSRVGADREGIEARIKAFDGRIAQLDADLATVGRELATNAPASLAVPDPIVRYRGFGGEDMVGAGFMGAGIMFAMFIPLMIKYFRRRRWAPSAGPTTQVQAVGSERIDRMEQAIDSIAVEIERVSENQRFMTRLMTETQLAGTLAAVRGSTEAAKAAAEKASNV